MDNGEGFIVDMREETVRGFWRSPEQRKQQTEHDSQAGPGHERVWEREDEESEATGDQKRGEHERGEQDRRTKEGGDQDSI